MSGMNARNRSGVERRETLVEVTKLGNNAAICVAHLPIASGL
jgi:hypothetical protein